MNLLNMATAKKVKTFLNKFVTQTKRARTSLGVKVEEKKVIHSLQLDDVVVSAVSEFDSIANFKEMKINMDEWHNALGKISKDDKEIQYLPVQTTAPVLTLNTKSLTAVIDEKQPPVYQWNNICNIYVAMALVNAISISNVAAGNGRLPVNSKVYFQIKDGELKILNTNDVILHQNVIPDVDGDARIFALANSCIPKLKQFLAYGNGATDVSIAICENMMMFYYKTKEFEAQFITPFEENDDVEKTFRSLERIMNTKFYGKPITLDEEDMMERGFEYKVAWLYRSGKNTVKVHPKMLKAEWDKFVGTANKQEAYKNMDKAIELDYLGLAKATGKELFIHRILYQNYIAMIQTLPYSIYLLSTKADALMFGSNDEMLRFKTLFMLRKPKEEVAPLTDDDLNAMENTKEEISLKEEDDDTFVPT